MTGNNFDLFKEINMYRLLFSILLFFLLTACSAARLIPAPPVLLPTTTSPDQAVNSGQDEIQSPVAPSYLPQAGDDSLKRDNAMLESKQILVLESYPPQYRLLLNGFLPTTCHQLRVKINPPGLNNRIDVEVYSVVKADIICSMALASFEVSVNLDGFSTGKYTVQVNGETLGEIEVPAQQ
jgi:hypothetical protein